MRTLLSVVPLGGEIQANMFTGQVLDPAVAVDEKGNSIVVWESWWQDGNGSEIYARQFNPAGVPLGEEIRVNDLLKGNQVNPSVAVDHNGDFVIAWECNNRDGGSTVLGSDAPDDTLADTTPANAGVEGVFARRFNSQGVKQGDEIFVGGVYTYSYYAPAVAMDADGDFVVAWQDWYVDCTCGTGTYFGLFDRNGARRLVDGERDTQVNTYTAGSQGNPAVAMDDAGNFVVAWDGMGPSEVYDPFYTPNVYARQFSSAGEPLADQFLVNTTVADYQIRPSVAMDGQGNFVISWDSHFQDCTCGYGVFAQRYASTGATVGGETQVNTYTCCSQEKSAAAMANPDSFIITWQSQHQDDGYDPGVYAQHAAQDHFISDEFRVNTYMPGAQTTPAAGANSLDDFVIAWESAGAHPGIFVQRFGQEALAIDGSGDPEKFLLMREFEGTEDDYFRNDTQVAHLPLDRPVNLMASDGDDELILDFRNGSPLPDRGLTFDGGTGRNILRIIRTSSEELIRITPGQVLFGTVPVNFTNADLVLGDDQGGTLEMGNLALLPGVKATVAGGGRTLLSTRALDLNENATLDIGANQLLIYADSDPVARALTFWYENRIGLARQDGAWTGVGLTSSAAAANELLTVAIMRATESKSPSVLGEPMGYRLLVGVTWNGDMDLSLDIGPDDYFRIDDGYIDRATGFRNGDLNYDRRIDSDDYFLIDQAYIGQNGVLPAPALSSRTAQAATTKRAAPRKAAAKKVRHAKPRRLNRTGSH